MRSTTLVLGERSLENALAGIDQPVGALTPSERVHAYPALAQATLQGEVIGSSAVGEQQRFTVTLAGPDCYESLIVKFADAGGNPVATRWASLLRCEALAAQTLSEHGIAAAANRALEAGGQIFLESARFDRTATLGRRGMVSLAALDAAFYGNGSIAWWQFAATLRDDGWISASDADTRQLAWWRWAANAGLHFWAAVAAEPVIDADLRRSAGEAQAAIQRALQWFAQE